MTLPLAQNITLTNTTAEPVTITSIEFTTVAGVQHVADLSAFSGGRAYWTAAAWTVPTNLAAPVIPAGGTIGFPVTYLRAPDPTPGVPVIGTVNCSVVVTGSGNFRHFAAVTVNLSNIAPAPGPGPAPAPTPGSFQPVVAINAGGPAVTAGNTAWLADSLVVGGTVVVGTLPITGTTQPQIYQSERWGPSTYTIPVTNSQYRVRLHLAEIWNGITAAGQRVFTIRLQGGTAQPVVITDIDIYAEVGFGAALIIERDITVTNQAITVEMIAQVQEPKISAIEILSESGGQYRPPAPISPGTIGGGWEGWDGPEGTYTPNTAAGENLVILDRPEGIRVPLSFFGVNCHYVPWQGSRFTLPAVGRFGASTWHGGWSGSKYVPLVNANMYEGGPGTMLQFMIKNPTKASGWTDADYDFELFDQWINYHRSIGIPVIIHAFVNIFGRNTIFNGNNLPTLQIPPVSPARFQDLVARVHARADNGAMIRYWETPNEGDSVGRLLSEPNGQYSGWNWANQVTGVSGVELANWCRYLKQKLIQLDAAAGAPGRSKVAGMNYAGPDTARTNAMLAFLEADAGEGTKAKDWIDVWSVHTYDYLNSKDQPTASSITVGEFDFRHTHLQLKQWVDGVQSKGRKPWYVSEWMGFGGPDRRLSDGLSTVERDWIRLLSQWGSTIALGGEMFSHFTWCQPGDYYGDKASTKGQQYKARWESAVGWILAKRIKRIAITTDNKIVFTNIDNETLRNDTM